MDEKKSLKFCNLPQYLTSLIGSKSRLSHVCLGSAVYIRRVRRFYSTTLNNQTNLSSVNYEIAVFSIIF